jgi:F-type H+-transporting ATPase subunit b
MSLTASVHGLTSRLPEVEFDIDDDGFVTSNHWLFPPFWEIVLGFAATGIVVGLLVWKAGPLVKKAMADRTARIQSELDRSSGAKTSAEAEAVRIRAAKGDIEGERQRLLAEADAQAEAVLADGRARLEQEVIALEARAEADIAAAAGRSGDELRAEITRYAAAATDEVVVGVLDDATQQELIEQFIARVGTGASA